MPTRRDKSGQSGFFRQSAGLIIASVLTGVLVAGLAIPFAGLLGLGARSTADALSNLPASMKQHTLPETTRVYAANGRLLANFYSQNRTVVPLKKIDPLMRKAIVSIEDDRFYEHGALDIRGTIRAFIANQASSDVVQGGSSITQQYVKMSLLESAKTAKQRAAATADTYARKLQELRYAVAVEDSHSKKWILEQYLNIAYFGDGVYGVEAAAQHYFSRSAKKLSLTQAALLAGLVKNPTAYDPTTFPDAAIGRRDVVLDRMRELRVISKDRARRALQAPLRLNVTPTPNGCVSTIAPFFCDYVRRYLMGDPKLGDTPQERLQLINTGGLTIETTLDPKIQRAGDRAVARNVSPTDNAIGGLAFVEPGSGAVRGLAQSRPMGRNAKAGQTYLNYVVDQRYGDANGFQGGSTFKAFTLAAAIKQGIPLNTTISAPQQIAVPEQNYRTCEGPYTSTAQWSPQNSTGAGTYDLYSGTQTSVNTFYAQLEERTGLCEPWRLANAMGVRLPESAMVPSFTLGVAPVSPLEMANAYATFAARGIGCDAHPVTEILDRDGKPLPFTEPTCTRVLAKRVADAVNDVLRGVQEPPSGFGYLGDIALDQPSAAKTGTTTGNMAVWFVGYTPNMSTAAMVAGANDRGSWITLNGQTLGGTRTDSAYGSTTAGPMWYAAMHAIEGMLKNTDFVEPPKEVIRGKERVVPSVAGFSVAQARTALRARGFEVAVSPSLVDSSYSYGTVAYTSPGAFSTATTSTTVTIYVSDGTPFVAPTPTFTPPPSPDPTQPPDPDPTPTPKPTQTPKPTPSPTPPPPTPTPPTPSPPTPTPSGTPSTPGNGNGHGNGNGGGGGGGGDGGRH